LPGKNTGIDTIKLAEISKRLITDNAYKGNAFAFIVLHKLKLCQLAELNANFGISENTRRFAYN